ncbi:hypothetical protein [Chengkuizengella marina]|uniref:Uncharacterized protein n=1 Tax=Chengkuizengella marina TaxID=2507566 RepID=A0A6N9Q1K0_9BACL|nr:hypothetical protein [Chengkuizengella marina]NBI27498.1 hypothetical protein [Chengkuizengella marina]
MKTRYVFLIGLLLITISINPIFLMLREMYIDNDINRTYVIKHADNVQGFPTIIQTNELIINNHHIKLIEENTGRLAPLTPWDIDEHVEAGEIIKLQIELNGKLITDSSEIWLSNRNRGSRYFSWIDILTVKNLKSNEIKTAIVQRLTDNNEKMEDRQWRIIHVNEKGEWREEVFGYQDRSEYKLGVKLVNFSNTALMSMGYYSDILKGWPTIFFPIIYPWISSAVGILLIFMSMLMNISRKYLYK